MFRTNKTITLNKQNLFHLFANFAVSLFGIIPGLISYSLWFIWEVLDGFKPDYREAPKNISEIQLNLLYSDGFSLEDVFIWNASGLALGLIVRGVLYEFGVIV